MKLWLLIKLMKMKARSEDGCGPRKGSKKGHVPPQHWPSMWNRILVFKCPTIYIFEHWTKLKPVNNEPCTLNPQVQWMQTHFSISPVFSVSTILTCTQLQKIEWGVRRGSLCSCRQDGGNRLSECLGDGRGGGGGRCLPLWGHRAREMDF